MVEPLLWFIAGCISGALLVTFVAIRKFSRWQDTAAELEAQLRSHSFELQITLDELAEKNQQLQQQTLTDSLSGAYNRAFFDQQMRAELKRSRREQRPLALVLIDIDHFKKINDRFGHLAGDRTIKKVASIIQQRLKRSGDKVCRYGGEEFAIVLPNTTLQGAWELADAIRSELTASTIDSDLPQLVVHISAGCYAAVAGNSSDNDEYINFADQALYKAKAGGRNQVQCYPPLTQPQPTYDAGANHEH